ncbi:hypothetical protein EAS54_06550 [Bradyrhizobium guangzhouense]|nr:hypothetical protein EAS54_06550 [Bradyrhizobium guangzhouense]
MREIKLQRPDVANLKQAEGSRVWLFTQIAGRGARRAPMRRKRYLETAFTDSGLAMRFGTP